MIKPAKLKVLTALVLDIHLYMKCFFVYAAKLKIIRYVKAENSKSFDFDLKIILKHELNLEANYFNLKYDDVLEGWKTGSSSGSAYTTQNMPGTVKSQGLEN